MPARYSANRGRVYAFNTWSIHYIESDDAILYPPCEGVSFVTFDQNSIEVTFSINSFSGSFAFVDASTVEIQGYANTLQIGTEEQMAFERLFFETLGRDSVLSLTIDGSFLTLTNTSNNNLIKLFIQP